MSFRVSVIVPYDPDLSKNAGYRGRRSARTARHFKALEALTARFAAVLAHQKIEKRKLYVRIFVIRPDLRSDPANLVDTVCDALKKACGVDDRYFAGSWDWGMAGDVFPASVRIDVHQSDADATGKAPAKARAAPPKRFNVPTPAKYGPRS